MKDWNRTPVVIAEANESFRQTKREELDAVINEVRAEHRNWSDSRIAHEVYRVAGLAVADTVLRDYVISTRQP